MGLADAAEEKMIWKILDYLISILSDQARKMSSRKQKLTNQQLRLSPKLLQQCPSAGLQDLWTKILGFSHLQTELIVDWLIVDLCSLTKLKEHSREIC